MIATLALAPLLLNQASGIYPVAYERQGHVLVIETSGARPKEIGRGHSPSVDPTGRRIAFVATRSDGTETVQVVSVRNAQEVLTPTGVPQGRKYRPAWSPDGNQLAFEHRFPEEGRTLYVWRIREPRALGVFNVTDDKEAMNPAFLSNDSVAFLWDDQIAVMNLKTSSFDRVDPKPFLDGLPDTARITALSNVQANPDLLAYAVDGPLQAIFLYDFKARTVLRLSPLGIVAKLPHTTPDPRRLAFWGTDENAETWLYSISLDGRTLTKVLQQSPALPQ